MSLQNQPKTPETLGQETLTDTASPKKQRLLKIIRSQCGFSKNFNQISLESWAGERVSNFQNENMESKI